MSIQVEPIFLARAELAEGPVWHEGALWWVDILVGTLNRFDPANGCNTSRALGSMIGAAVPCEDGRWLVAHQSGFAFLDWETGVVQEAGQPDFMNSRNRFNDGKCDPVGRFWAGTLNLDNESDKAALYVFDRDGSIRCGHTPVSLSNGLAWSPDGGTFYHVDTLRQVITAFDFDPESGALANPRPWTTIPEHLGFPDGMAIDDQGNLWVALWGGGAVICLEGRSGKIIGKISLPVSRIASCCFGGSSGETLFITSAWQGLSPAEREAEALAGSLFSCRPGVSGPPPSLFKPLSTIPPSTL